jgi:hypothetical protein
MNALNSVAVGISGLVFAGTAALTAGAALPANAQVTVSTPQMNTSSRGKEERGSYGKEERGSYGKEERGRRRVPQSNACRDTARCMNMSLSISGNGNRVFGEPLQVEDEKGKYGNGDDRDGRDGWEDDDE